MKHNYLALAIILLILSVVAGDTRVQCRADDKCIPGSSDQANPQANAETEKSGLEEHTGLNFSIGIVMPENSL
jgi:hypothetical protein